MLFSFLSTTVAALGLWAGACQAMRLNPGSDPSIMQYNGSYYWAATNGKHIIVKTATTLDGLAIAGNSQEVWVDSAGLGSVWAPEILAEDGEVYIYFSAGDSSKHRMYVIHAESPFGKYTKEQKLALPDDQWAIDGTYFIYNKQRYFVWSGWSSTSTNAEQNLYICKMKDPLTPTGSRTIISQARETWEKGDSPLVNEAPEVIVDPEGRLHVVYSANGSWGDRYCIADLRLKKDGNPEKIWDFYKSNGCLFGSHQDRMMKGWDATVYIDGPGHHTFALPDGDISQSPKGTSRIPFVFHGVKKGTKYSWGARAWYTGSYVWWSKVTYSRANVPGDNNDVGYSFKFFEDKP